MNCFSLHLKEQHRHPEGARPGQGGASRRGRPAGYLSHGPWPPGFQPLPAGCLRHPAGCSTLLNAQGLDRASSRHDQPGVCRLPACNPATAGLAAVILGLEESEHPAQLCPSSSPQRLLLPSGTASFDGAPSDPACWRASSSVNYTTLPATSHRFATAHPICHPLLRQQLPSSSLSSNCYCIASSSLCTTRHSSRSFYLTAAPLNKRLTPSPFSSLQQPITLSRLDHSCVPPLTRPAPAVTPSHIWFPMQDIPHIGIMDFKSTSMHVTPRSTFPFLRSTVTVLRCCAPPPDVATNACAQRRCLTCLAARDSLPLA